LNESEIAPTRGTKGSVGWDIYSPFKQVIPPKSVRKIRTGLGVEMPKSVYCRLYGRSSLCLKGLIFNTGVIDTDYRGELCAIAYNTLDESFYFSEGDRIGQLIFSRYVETEWIEVEQLGSTARGAGGFGSTGR